MAIQSNSWKCSVCGYVSDTEMPPESCPVCGVPKEKFEIYVSPKAISEKPSYWRCMVCSHQHKGAGPPDNCPVCGVGSEKFEGVKETEAETLLKNNDKIVIAGAGIAGLAAAEEIRRISDTVEITLIHRESILPYYRLNLTRYIAGEITSDVLPIHPENWYKKNKIDLVTDAQIVNVNSVERSVELKDGRKIDYKKLILTAGSHPFQPPVPGSELDGVTTLRYRQDADKIIAQSEKIKDVVVIGGGVLGLEVAGALSARNKDLNISIIEGFDYLMPRQLNEKAAEYLKNHLTGIGINIVSKTSVNEIRGNGNPEEVVLANGETLPAQLVIFSVGVRPATHLARGCDLKVNHGVIVDDNMETSTPGIFAAGDIAEHRGVVYGLWNAAMFEGKIAGMNAAGKKAEFGGIPRSNTLKVLDVNLFSIGNFNACDGSCLSIEEETDAEYSYILFRDSKIEGAVLYGNTSRSALIKTAIEEKISVPGSIIRNNELNGVFEFLSEQV